MEEEFEIARSSKLARGDTLCPNFDVKQTSSWAN